MALPTGSIHNSNNSNNNSSNNNNNNNNNETTTPRNTHSLKSRLRHRTTHRPHPRLFLTTTTNNNNTTVHIGRTVTRPLCFRFKNTRVLLLLRLFLLLFLQATPASAKITIPFSTFFSEGKGNNNNNNKNGKGRSGTGTGGGTAAFLQDTNSARMADLGAPSASDGAAAFPAPPSDGGGPIVNSPSPTGSGSSSSSTTPTTVSNLRDLEDILLQLWDQYSKERGMVRDVLIEYPRRVAVFVWYNIILYRPPVGIVAAWTLTRLVTSGRLFQPPLWARPNEDGQKGRGGRTQSEQLALAGSAAGSTSRLDRHTGRAMDLDRDDLLYKQYGGIERVRRRLAWSALETFQRHERDALTTSEGRVGRSGSHTSRTTTTTTPSPAASTTSTTAPTIDPPSPSIHPDATVHGLVDALETVLKAAFSPGGSHADHVEEMIRPLAIAEGYAIRLGLHGTGGTPSATGLPFDANDDTGRLLRISLQTAEVHMLDSMLRLTRDQLLRTSFRLARTVKFWRRRVQSSQTPTSLFLLPLLRRLRTFGTEGDRMRLAFAEAAYRAEIVRLGKVLNLLGERPPGMADSNLTLAVQKTLLWTEQLPQNQHPTDGDQQHNNKWNTNFFGRSIRTNDPPTATPSSSSSSSSSPGSRESSRIQQERNGLFSFLPTSFTFPNMDRISNFALRYNVDGRGKFNFQTYDASVTTGGMSAMQVLLDDYETTQQPWLDMAHDWTLRVRTLIYETIQDALETSVQPTTAQEEELAKFQTTWRLQQYHPHPSPTNPSSSSLSLSAGIEKQWTFILDMIRGLHKLRRVGDGKSLKLQEVNFIHWLQQWDLMGLPSAMLQIYLANVLHRRLLPYWPRVQSILQEAFDVVNEIVQTRFWTPFKALVDELMDRKRDKLLTGVSLQDEETSLDNMLRDLGFGDGTPATRHAAMLRATRQYESDMNTGLMRHALGGRLVRLMLIQVQQLKVGVLDAGEAVDVLFQANRFNIQLLAIIPAVVIIGVGTKVFLRFLFAVRVKDIRPMSSVHAEMTEYLNELESVILLTDKTPDQQMVPAKQVLTERQVGEFALTLYDYLVLLDYSSPQPFPKWQCDGIHKTITEFLGRSGSFERLTLDDQLRLIDLVKRKHQELAKYL